MKSLNVSARSIQQDPQEQIQDISALPWPKRIVFFVTELQGGTPILLSLFALVTLIFIIIAGVEEGKSLKHVRKTRAATLAAESCMKLTENFLKGAGFIRVVDDFLSELSDLKLSNDVDEGLIRNLAVQDEYMLLMDALETFHSSLAIDMLSSKKFDKTDSAPALSFIRLWSMVNGVQHFHNILQLDEGDPDATRLIESMSHTVLCDNDVDLVSAELSSSPKLRTVCGAAADEQLKESTLVGIDFPKEIDMSVYQGVVAELEGIQFAVNSVVDHASTEIDDKNTKARRTFANALLQSVIAFVVAIIGVTLSIMLIRGQKQYFQEQSVVESDFICAGTKVRLQPSTLRSVDMVLNGIGAMEKRGEASEESGQIEMHLRMALAPLSRLRPFVPEYMFLKNSSSASVSRSMHMVDSHMLNLQRGVKKSMTSILYIGLRKLNEEDADTHCFSRLLPIVQRCTSHFHGSIVQICSAAIISTFTRALVNEDEEDERLEDGEVLASHAAFAIQSLSQNSVDPMMNELSPIPITMIVAHSSSLEGIAAFHVSTHYVILSRAITRAVKMEELSETHNVQILTDADTNDLICDYFLTRPVHFIKGIGTVHHLVFEEPDEMVPNREEIMKEQERIREKSAHWSKAWERYELLMQADHPTYELLEDAYRDIEGYKVFMMSHEETDTAFSIANANIKRIAAQMAVSLGATLEDD